jgi:restriction system protein
MPDAAEAGAAGADLVLTAGAGTWRVQARQWRAPKVGVEQIQVLHGVMLAHGADAGVLVSTGLFTDEAMRQAAGLNIELLGGEDLLRRVRRARDGVGATAALA